MMDSLKYAFIIPVIALATVILLYYLLLKKVNDPIALNRMIRIILALAFVLDFLWEMAQMPLFKNMPFTGRTTLFCALATIADCIMVLLLYLGFGLIYKDPMWFRKPDILPVLFLIIAGGVGAVLAERQHLFEGNWAYNSYMPLVPVVDVGLSPILQFMVLPATIYYVASAILGRKERKQLHWSHGYHEEPT